MNRFRTKKKGKDEGGGMGSMGRSFRRGRKAQNEQKKELDIDTALPSRDDFRTSLLMNGLSARFSLLREQDDPNTKIGKASDDSVLFANRQSRLMDFGYANGHGPLADIAEVESIKAPPSFNRMDSFMSDDGDSLQGSIMSRGKPTEGNNLFGGRQKIYKITDGAATGRGGMTGKALYGDDVATSAFQRWRQAEKAALALTGDGAGEESVGPRPESPVSSGYNRKRETSSTSSSANSLGWNSTGSTSLTSQPPAFTRDWQPGPASTAPTSVSSTPGLDRSFTRTRRLYEQGLTHELHEQQSSALSRIDTLSRQRNVGSRTPDLAQMSSPSPTAGGFGDRLGSERRQILTKASAPNLRSINPLMTTSASSTTLDLGTRVPAPAEGKNNYGGSPPLSPPISESGDRPILPIQPNDRGKATAMGVFQKPSQPYDESRYAQRQLQLQLGRDTPTQRFRAESNASVATDRSRSSSSLHRHALDSKAEQLRMAQPATLQEESHATSFLDDSDTSPLPGTKFAAAQPGLQRPADSEHPAFRHQSALPTPLSLAGRASEEPSPISEVPDMFVSRSPQVSPEDSPTLGPGPAGLSGMVRQHLRNDSNASSVYGAMPQSADFSHTVDLPQVPEPDAGSSFVDSVGSKFNPWSLQEPDWVLPNQGTGASPAKSRASTAPSEKPSSKAASRSSRDDAEGEDFANQLANARRRVRERLTSYVESDTGRSESPQRPSDPITEGQSSRSNPLGIGLLKPKSSRGSLIDRSRELVGSQSKAMKMLGIGLPTMSNTSTAPGSLAFEDHQDASTALPTMREDQALESVERETTSDLTEEASDAESKSLKDEDNVHPGLRAFRQARRELQRRKELETLARRQVHGAHHQSPDQPAAAPNSQATSFASERGGRQRTPSRERKPPPPVAYRSRAASQESKHSAGSVERGRSGTDSSNGRSGSRTAFLQSEGAARDSDEEVAPHSLHHLGAGGQLGPQSSTVRGPASRPGMLRSPGLPGTDIRQSPILPPQSYHHPGSGQSSAAPSPRPFDRSNSAGNLQPGRAGHEVGSGQPSPASPLPPFSPLGLPASPLPGAGGYSSATTPTTLVPSPRRPSAPPAPGFSVTASTLNESLKKVVNKADISEPTFIMSTSRVPTVALPSPGGLVDGANTDNGQQRSRSGSRTRGDAPVAQIAPPLPPINPMRRQETSRSRGMLGNPMGRRGDGFDDMASLSSPHLPLASPSENASRENLSGLGHNTFSLSDDEDQPDRQKRRMHKQGIEGNPPGPQMRPYGRPVGRDEQRDRGKSPPFVATGPPVGRSIITPIKTTGGTSIPGGMF